MLDLYFIRKCEAFKLEVPQHGMKFHVTTPADSEKHLLIQKNSYTLNKKKIVYFVPCQQHIFYMFLDVTQKQ
jgi:hypothetical protein